MECQHSLAGDREFASVRTAENRKGHGLRGQIGVGGGDGQHGSRVLRHVGRRCRGKDRHVLADRRDRDNDVLHRRAAVAVAGLDRHVVDVVLANVGRILEVWGCLKRQHSAAGDREFQLIRSADETERDGLCGLIGIGGRDGQHGGRILGDIGGRDGGEDRAVVVYGRDRDGDVLHGGQAVVVVSGDLDVVNIVCAVVGRAFKVRRRLEGQHSATGDRELRLIRSACEAVADRLAGQVRIGGDYGQNGGRVLGHVGGRTGGEDRTVVVHRSDCHSDLLSGQPAVAVVRLHSHVVNVVRPRIGWDFKIGSRDERQDSRGLDDLELRRVCSADD